MSAGTGLSVALRSFVAGAEVVPPEDVIDAMVFLGHDAESARIELRRLIDTGILCVNAEWEIVMGDGKARP